MQTKPINRILMIFGQNDSRLDMAKTFIIVATSAPSDTTMPLRKRRDLLKKNINMNLLFFNKKVSFVLNKVFDILIFCPFSLSGLKSGV